MCWLIDWSFLTHLNNYFLTLNNIEALVHYTCTQHHHQHGTAASTAPPPARHRHQHGTTTSTAPPPALGCTGVTVIGMVVYIHLLCQLSLCCNIGSAHGRCTHMVYIVQALCSQHQHWCHCSSCTCSVHSCRSEFEVS